MSSEKEATQTQYHINDVEMPDAQTPAHNNNTSYSIMHNINMTHVQLPSYYNHTAVPTTKFSFWRSPSTRRTMSQTDQTQHNLFLPFDAPQHSDLIQQLPSPAPTWTPNPQLPQLRSPSPVEPLESLVPRGHGPCNRCGTCTSRYFYQSKWEPDRECCYACWEPDREGRGDDTLEEWRVRYFLKGVGNSDVGRWMDVEEDETEEAKVVREGWGMAALGPVEDWREREAAWNAEREADEGMKIYGDWEVEKSGAEIVVESQPLQARDEVVGRTENIVAVAGTVLIPPPPPSARFWDYKTEPKPEPGFKETPVEVLKTLTRSGKVVRRSN